MSEIPSTWFKSHSINESKKLPYVESSNIVLRECVKWTSWTETMSIKSKHTYRSRKWTTGEGVDEVTPKTSRTRSTSSHVGRRKGIILSPTFPCWPEELMTIEQVFCKNFWHTSYSALSFTRQKHKCILPFQAMFLKKKHTHTD